MSKYASKIEIMGEEILLKDSEGRELLSDLSTNTKDSLSTLSTNVKDSLSDIAINVKDYLCDDGEYVKGDGIHDDTSGIQKAFDSLAGPEVGHVGNAWDITTSYSVPKILFPAGIYLISQTLKGYDYMNITGVNRSSSIIMSRGCDLISFDNKYNFKISDITLFEKNEAKAHSAIKVNVCAHMIFDNVGIRGFDIGYDFYQGFSCAIMQPHVVYTTHCIDLMGSNNSLGCHAVRIYGGEISGGSGVGATGIRFQYGNGISVIGSTLEGYVNGAAIELLENSICTNLLLESLYFENNLGDIVGTNSSLGSTKIRNCFMAGTGKANKKFIYSDGMFNAEITNCVFGNLAASALYKHIDCPSTTTQFINSEIDNNKNVGGNEVQISSVYINICETTLSTSKISNSIREYNSKLLYGQSLYMEEPKHGHIDEEDNANYTKLQFNSDGTISTKYWRNYSFMGTKTGLDVIGAGGSSGDGSWSTPTLINNWTNFGSGNSTAAYRKTGDGRVSLKGMVKGGALSSVIFILPSGYRPSEMIRVTTSSSGVVCEIQIGIEGSVTVISGAVGSYLLLNNINFYS